VDSGEDTRTSAVTPIELLCAVATAVVLLALGYSAYRTHAAREQVSAAVATATGIAPYVARDFLRTGEVSSQDELAVAGELALRTMPFLASISVVNGRIDVTFSAEAHDALAGEHLSLNPYETATMDIVWICGNSRPGPGLQPFGFASGGPQATALPTTIDSRYLPPDCR
jgi:Tfp pilus assembly protein PilE